MLNQEIVLATGLQRDSLSPMLQHNLFTLSEQLKFAAIRGGVNPLVIARILHPCLRVIRETGKVTTFKSSAQNFQREIGDGSRPEGGIFQDHHSDAAIEVAFDVRTVADHPSTVSDVSVSINMPTGDPISVVVIH